MERALAYLLLLNAVSCCLQISGSNEPASAGTSSGRGNASVAGAGSSGTRGGAGASSSGGSTGTSSGGDSTTGAQCVVAGQSYPARAVNPSNAAECCNPAISGNSWLPLFTKTESFAVGSPTVEDGNNDAMLGDLNQDGIADALVTAYLGPTAASQAWAYLSSPPITWNLQVGKAGSEGEVWPGSPAIGDINGDGLPDMLMSTDDSVEVFLNQGGGQFGPEIYNSLGGSCFGAWLKVGDVNNDGRPDVVAATGHCGLLLFVNGDGALQPFKYLTATAAGSRIALGDFDGDGLADISFVSASDELMWMPGNSPSKVRPLGVYGSVGQAVIPMQGGNGLAVATSSTLYVFPPGDGGLGPPVQHSLDVQNGDVQVGDLNGDGLSDIVVASGWGGGQSLDILVATGDGLFESVSDLPLPGGQNIQRIALGDLNGDGALDLGVFRGGGPWELWINSCGAGAAQAFAETGTAP